MAKSRPVFTAVFRLLARNRYQLLGAIFIANVGSALLWTGELAFWRALRPEEITFLGTLVATLGGAFLLRRMTAYPGVSTLAFLVPAFGTAYGMVILAFFFLRLDYSRAQFIISFVLTLLWFGAVGAIEPRIRRLRFALIPVGEADHLLASNRADWLILRRPADLPNDVSGVVADFNASMAVEWDEFLAQAALSGLPVYHWKQLAESLTGTVSVDHLSENTFGSLLPSSTYFKIKRLLDLVVIVVALPVVVPLTLAAAVAIRLEGSGPVLFWQERLGFRGRPFMMAKFRSMAFNVKGPSFTSIDDTRITRVGRFIRQYRIDELPQLINIVKGEMSWIGPRPEAHDLAQWYKGQIPFYNYRHILRPGLTGWAQVHQGNVAELKAITRKLRYDFYYVKHFSPWLDLLIAAKTVKIVLTGFGSR